MPKVSNVYRDSRNGSWYFVANLGTDGEGKRVRYWGRGYKTQKDAKAPLPPAPRLLESTSGLSIGCGCGILPRRC